MKSSRIAIFCIFLAIFSSLAFGVNSDIKLTEDQLSGLIKVLSSADVLSRLQNNGSITKDETQNQLDFILKDAQEILGESTTIEEIADIIRNTQQGRIAEVIEVANNTPGLEVNQPTSFAGKVMGMMSFVNLVLATSALMMVLGLVWLFSLYILPLVIRFIGKFPKEFYEVAIYGAILASFFLGLNFQETVGLYISLLGCFALPFAIAFSLRLHLNGTPKDEENALKIISSICSLVYIALAIIMQSWFIGILAILSLMATLGFSFIVMPGVYCIGFEDKNALARGTTAAFLITASFVILSMLGINASYVQVFSVGALYVGPFVFFLGMLIASSKWYGHRGHSAGDHYFIMQLFMAVSCVAAIFIGSVYNINELRGFAGTFMYLYLMEKYLEIPHLNKHWAWATFFFGLILYAFAMVIKSYPQYFLASLF